MSAKYCPGPDKIRPESKQDNTANTKPKSLTIRAGEALNLACIETEHPCKAANHASKASLQTRKVTNQTSKASLHACWTKDHASKVSLQVRKVVKHGQFSGQ